MRTIGISKVKLYSFFGVWIIALFAFSTHSLGGMVPSSIRFLFLFSAIALIFLSSIQRNKPKLLITDAGILLVAMLLIIWLWNNQNIPNEMYSGDTFLTAMIIFCMLGCRFSDWQPYALKAMIITGLFYAAWTMACYFFPNFYFSFVYPLISSVNPNMLASKVSVMAGLTSHYSSNGMYQAMGLCAIMASFFFNGEEKKKQKKYRWLALVFAVLGMLFTGKRGQVICILVALYVTYYIYMGKKKGGRILKILSVTIGIALFIYVASFFIPGVLTIIDRFQQKIEVGDVLTGRNIAWGIAWTDFLNRPLYGHGWCWFRYSSASVALGGVHVHNCYLQWLTEMGLLGSAPFFTFALILYYRAIRLFSMVRNGILTLQKNATMYLAFAVLYQSFFLIFCFEGTGFYETESICPYFISCAIILYYWEYARLRNNYIRLPKD